MKTEKKGLNVLGAISDMIVFVLLVGGAAFVGYFIGINQRLAPVEIVPPGTIEAIKQAVERTTNTQLGAVAPTQTSPMPAVAPVPLPAAEPARPSIATKPDEKARSKEDSSKPTTQQKNSKADSKSLKDKNKSAASASTKKKFWIASSGNDYIGSSVTVTVNGRPVDSFFGPGKLLDVSSLVKKGNNVVTFVSRSLDDDYNLHLGDDKFALTLKLVSGPVVSEAFNSSEVLLSFRRSAAESEDGSKSMDFAVRE